MSEVRAEWKDGRLYVDGEPLPAIFKASGPAQGSRITFTRLTPKESAVLEAAIAFRSSGFWALEHSGSVEFVEAVDALIEERKRLMKPKERK